MTASGITYPASLPIVARREELLVALREHQVVIVAGETGSGKSTQLPKMCLEIGRGVDGWIGHTQPRRIAARTIAERVASELNSELGQQVGYAVRFTDKVSAATQVKVMTDGILLAEIQRDRMLRRYDTLIIDEAHERSLNIDFLLGYLKRLLPQRPDLKLIVTSATIDTATFSRHFDDAPVVEVTGRSYPVEIRYRPLDEDNGDQVLAISAAVSELHREGPGDILVFLSGEREIHDTADALRRENLAHTDVLPLYARLAAAEQHRIFAPSGNQRRIVLATNVAETSLTVPGVRYVIDAGTARISRFSQRLKVQRLPIEAISQASANQRSGRCGRVAAGVCIRLYDEADFTARPEFTEPEILRTNLASVILQMAALGLGSVRDFPFVEPPDDRAIRDGVALLEELGALHPDEPIERPRLTTLGRRLARLPIDPRFGRMVLEAERHGCVREVMVIAAALSIQDPRERPQQHQQVADEMHARFKTEGSDFLSFVALWNHLRERQRELSGNQFRKLCAAEHLNYLRVREWQDLFSQIRQIAGTLGIRSGTDAGHPDRIHQSVLAGLLSHIGMRDGETREYRGARGSKFMIAPGSVVARKQPRWLIAAELVETNRLWGRVAAPIQPEWAERLAGPLAKRSYGEATWDEQAGRATTIERVSLYGLAIVSGRRIGVDRVDPELAREMFIRHALVDGQWNARHAFIARNLQARTDIAEIGDRIRRNDLIDDERLHAFFDQRVGAEALSARHFDTWWKAAAQAEPTLLDLTVEALLGPHGAGFEIDDFPTMWASGAANLPLSYRFDPGDELDGVSVHIPLAILSQIDPCGFDWQVPGLRDELIEALLWSLAKAARRLLVPIAQSAQRVGDALRSIEPTSTPLPVALARELATIAGTPIRANEFDLHRVPAHLRISFVVEDEQGVVVGHGKDLEAVQQRLSARVRAAVAASTSGIEQAGLIAWSFGELPLEVETERHGHVVRGYPTLVDDGDSVSVRVFTKSAVQAKLMPGGLRRLVLLAVPLARKAVGRGLDRDALLAIGAHPRLSLVGVIDDCAAAAVDQMIVEYVASNQGAWPRTAAEFDALIHSVRSQMTPRVSALVGAAGVVIAAAERATRALDRLVTAAMQASVSDARAHLERLVRPGFVTIAGAQRFAEVERYVRAIEHRAGRIAESVAKDLQRIAEVTRIEREYAALLTELKPSQITEQVSAVGWMIEELRVGTFAQVVGVKGPASEAKIRRAIAEVRAAIGGDGW